MDPAGRRATEDLALATSRREFFGRTRRDGESSGQYLAVLEGLGATCDFGAATELLVNARFSAECPGATLTAPALPVNAVKPASIGSPFRGNASTAHQMQLPRYKKLKGAADGTGVDYECKMLTLVFLRMLSTGHEFQLASNMEEAGLFDDIVLRHRQDPNTEWAVSYVQLKHKQNKNTIISRSDLFGITGDFSLVKYCASYEIMKSSAELLSFGTFVKHKICLFTNASIIDSLVDVLESDPLISTGGKVVSFKAGGEVYRGLCEWVDFKEALTELYCKVDGKSAEEVELKTNDVLKCVKYNNKAVSSWKGELLKSPTLVKLKELLKRLEPVNDKVAYSSFLAKLRMFTSQAHESQLDAKIKEQLAKVWICRDDLEATVMLNAIQSQVKSWWQKDNVYLTQDSPLWLGVVKSQTELLSKTTIDGLKKFGVEFMDSSLQVLHDRISGVSGILNLRVDSRTSASSLKVHQALAKFGARDLNVLHVNLKAFLERETDMLAAWSTRWCQVLVLECDQLLATSKAGELASKIIEVFVRKTDSKHLVLIASKKHELNVQLYHSNLYMRFYDNIVWGDLTEKAKEVMLSTKIRINGSQVALSDFVSGDKGFVNKADMEVISQFLQNNFSFGKDLEEGDKFFVTRRLRETADSDPFVVNSVNDVRRKVVLVVAEPGMGKSTLITHLAKSAKTEDGVRRWIVHIKLSERSQSLKEMDVGNFNEVTARKFLEESALSTGNSLEKLLFGVLEGKLVVFIDGVDEVCPHYEEQIFTLLRFAKELKLHQLWVASRPVFLTKLEIALGVKTLHMVAFSVDDRKEFFNKVWKANIPSAIPERCQEVTASLLTWLTDSLGQDNPILGVPLMAAMIAETFQDRMFTKDGAVREFKINERLDVVSLYQTFVEKKFLRYCVEKKKTPNRELAAIRDDEETLRKQMHHNHSLAALRFLFSREEIDGLQFDGKEKFDDDLTTYLKEVSEGREKMGIIDNVIDGNPHFIHRPFAEFFSSMWLGDNYHGNSKFVEKLFFDPAYKLISEMCHRTLAANHRLHVAVLHRDLQLTKRILDVQSNPCNVNSLDKGGRTPLHLAVLLSSTDRHENCIIIVKSLIQEYKARLDVVDEVLGWLPLRYAERARAWTALDIILENGGPKLMTANVGWPRPDPGSMLQAARDASLTVVRYLHESRGGKFDCRGPNGETMIHMAAEGANVEVLKYLSNKGRSVRYLLERGLSLDTVNNQGLTALQVAAQNGAYDAVAVLFKLKVSLQVSPSASAAQLNASLLCAAFSGSSEVVQKLVDKGASYDHRDNKGHTAAWFAWHRGHFEVMDWLLTRGYDEDTSLSGACRLGETELVASILSRGADIEGKGLRGQTPLIAAAEEGHLAVVTLLLEKGANIVGRDKHGLTALQVAAQNGAYDLMAVLLEFKGSFEVSPSERNSEAQLNASLLGAAFAGSLKSVQKLVENGALLRHRDNKGHTAAWISWHRGHVEVMDWLLAHGYDGDTPLSGACRLGELEMVTSILSRGADIEGKGRRLGHTPLIAAAEEGHLDVVALLLANGAKVGSRDDSDETPLHHASSDGREPVVVLLLRHQVDVNVTDMFGMTPLHRASWGGRDQVAALLLRHHADVNVKDKDGWTPLHHASWGGREQVAALLLRHHADVNVTDNDGLTPLDLATVKDHSGMLTLLIAAGGRRGK